jgi:DNA polymerase III epsilon subunit family exonuclease
MSNKYEISRSGSLRNVSFAVVDCETTGVNPETDRILQVAAIIVNGEGEVVDQFDTVVRPESPENYTHGAEHIHGISKEQVENGMPLREALEKLWTISSGNVFTAHNARFDIGFLHAESERVGLSNRIETHVDTLALARKTDAEKTRRHTLDALCEHYGIEREKAHDAKADATATAELLIHLMKEMGVERSDQLPDLFA